MSKNVGRGSSSGPGKPSQPAWTPSPAGKGQATTYRIIAAVLWVLAIAGEAYAIFVLLKQNPINLTYLIGAIVVIGVLAVIGDLLWKRANQLDPASADDPTRFFIQNQLGAIIGIIAFLPLIVLIFTNKNMSQQQKAIAGGIGVVALLIAGITGTSFNPPSTQEYAATQAALTPALGVSGTPIPIPGAGTPAPTGSGLVGGKCPQGCTAQFQGCAIKGNINDGRKLYHIPGNASYNETIIDPAKGEKWFCTEAEATANGWVKAER